MNQSRVPSLIQEADVRGFSRAVEILRQGGVVAYPTETFYGLGCRADLESAVERIFQIKGRGDEQAPAPDRGRRGDGGRGGLDERARLRGPGPPTLARVFWPGPLTLLLPARKPFPKGVAPRGKIALRVSAHPLARALSRNLNLPLVSTSANLSGQPPAVLALQVEEGLAQDPPGLILRDDPCPGGAGSTILDLTVAPAPDSAGRGHSGKGAGAVYQGLVLGAVSKNQSALTEVIARSGV